MGPSVGMEMAARGKPTCADAGENRKPERTKRVKSQLELADRRPCCKIWFNGTFVITYVLLRLNVGYNGVA